MRGIFFFGNDVIDGCVWGDGKVAPCRADNLTALEKTRGGFACYRVPLVAFNRRLSTSVSSGGSAEPSACYEETARV